MRRQCVCVGGLCALKQQSIAATLEWALVGEDESWHSTALLRKCGFLFQTTLLHDSCGICLFNQYSMFACFVSYVFVYVDE